LYLKGACFLLVPVQLRLRQPGVKDASNELTCLEVAYDQVEAQIVAELAHNSSSNGTDSGSSGTNNRSLSSDRDASNAASINELLSAVLDQSSSSSSMESSSSLSFDGIDASIDPEAWLQRFKGLTETEALQELAVLKHLGGQAGVLRPKAHSGFSYGGRGTATVAASAGGKKKKRATKANAKSA